jgi:hypothetical protein
MQISIDVICDKNATEKYPIPTIIYDIADPCITRMQVRSVNGCSIASINALWAFLNKYIGLWGAMMIVLGLILDLFGRKLFQPTIFILSTAAFVFASLLFFYSVFFNSNTKAYVGWIVLGLSTVIGGVIGFFLAKISKAGVAILGGWGGFCLGLILYSAFLYKTQS